MENLNVIMEKYKCGVFLDSFEYGENKKTKIHVETE